MKFVYRCIQNRPLCGMEPCPVIWMDRSFTIGDAEFVINYHENEMLRDVHYYQGGLRKHFYYAEDWRKALSKIKVKTGVDTEDYSTFLGFTLRLASRLSSRRGLFSS